MKIVGVVWMLDKINEWSEKKRCFSESEKLRCEKNS